MCTDLSRCPLLSHIRVPAQSRLPPPFPMLHCKPPGWSPQFHSLPIPDQPRSTLTDFPSPSPAKDFYPSAQRALLWLPFKVTDGEHTFTKIYRCLSLSITSCMPICFFSLECSPLQPHLPKLLLSSSYNDLACLVGPFPQYPSPDALPHSCTPAGGFGLPMSSTLFCPVSAHSLCSLPFSSSFFLSPPQQTPPPLTVQARNFGQFQMLSSFSPRTWVLKNLPLR